MGHGALREEYQYEHKSGSPVRREKQLLPNLNHSGTTAHTAELSDLSREPTTMLIL
jgi:hypothetical protein